VAAGVGVLPGGGVFANWRVAVGTSVAGSVAVGSGVRVRVGVGDGPDVDVEVAVDVGVGVKVGWLGANTVALQMKSSSLLGVPFCETSSSR